ncbi:glutathione S-transferase family protein [Qipengyuania marisflavi]|uniref:glutathione transferase n=1 Tax=Qipengyuania marisflavi TaxID=2486356 RepID=A0A5S3PF05_9SPHN|nr:glutathione S-transferase [Qipengyuania marisflavi]TMM50170.1 glutathione S-transferase [Qipengyuania marisflavi]
MTITVHHLNNSRSQRILWLLEELGAEYEISHYQRDATTNLAPPELGKVHPLGKSPVIEDGGRMIGESAAILQYLCERHGGADWLSAHDSEDYPGFLEWMHYGEGSFMTPVLIKIYLGTVGEAAAPVLERNEASLKKHVQFMEDSLSDDLHFVGSDWTAADVLMSFPAEVAIMQGHGENCPKLARFVEAVHARPAWQRSREKGGAYFIW